MATYQDIHRIIKETIQVDAEPSKRWTPQLVKFINHDNEFYGKFYGKVDATEFFASNASLSNVDLSSCRLYDLSGNELDLNTLFPMISAMNQRFDDISSMVYVTLPQWHANNYEKICEVSTYVNTVSSGISVLIDEKIKESESKSSEGLSVISTILQDNIDEETRQRIISDDTLQAQISEISGKIKGGVVYKGLVYNADQSITTLSSLLLTQEGSTEEDEIRNGFMYVIKGHRKTIEGMLMDNGDYLYINTAKTGKAFDTCKIKDVTKDIVDILDVMDSQVYTLISQISSDVEGLKVISAAHELNIITERNNRISNVQELRAKTAKLSTDLDGLSAKVYGLSGDFDFDTDSLSVITKIAQRQGKIEVEARKLVSGDVEGLKDFVQNEIGLSVNSLTSENGTDGEFIVSVLQENGVLTATHSKVTNSFIEDDSIAQFKITDLSSDLYNMSAEISTIARRNRGDVSWMGDFRWTHTASDVKPLPYFLVNAIDTHGQEAGYKLRKGFLYRNIAEQSVSCGSVVKTFDVNDYLMVDSDVVISDATFDSFRYIKDYDKELENLEDYTNKTFVKLSGDNQISGNNTYDGRQIFNCSVDFNDNHVTFNGFQVTNSGYIAHASTGNLIVGNQLRIKSNCLQFTDVSVNFKDISVDFQTQISKNRTDIDNLSSEVKELDVENKIGSGEILTSLSQTDGKISYGVTKLLSSHVEGLSDYVQDELTKKVESLDVDVISSEGRYIDSVWEENGKISATTRRIVSSDIDELSNYVQNEINLSIVNITSDNTIEGKIISSITQENGVVEIGTTDILSAYVVGLSDYVEDEIKKNNVKLSGEYVHLSGNNSISGYNAFLGDLSVTTMSVMSFGDIYDMGEEFLSARLPSLEDPYISKIHEQINDIIKYSGIDVQQLGNIDDTICEEIKDRTERIYEIAYGSIPSVETFGDVTNCLNAVLGVLKDKETGISLEDRLQRLQGGIDSVHEMAQILNQDLSSLCIHVNTDIGELREDVSELSSNLNTLSADYHNLKDNTFRTFDSSKEIDSMGLIVTDEAFGTYPSKHDRYVMTFLSGTLVLEKI